MTVQAGLCQTWLEIRKPGFLALQLTCNMSFSTYHACSMTHHCNILKIKLLQINISELYSYVSHSPFVFIIISIVNSPPRSHDIGHFLQENSVISFYSCQSLFFKLKDNIPCIQPRFSNWLVTFLAHLSQRLTR